MAPTLDQLKTMQCGAHLSDKEVGLRVRMLMRDDLDHEAVCCMARDRIRYLSAALEARDREISELQNDLSELKSIRRDFLEFVKKVSRATVTVPWETGYGPEYVPTAGDPERSVSDLISVVRLQTARECAAIADTENASGRGGSTIRERFGVGEKSTLSLEEAFHRLRSLTRQEPNSEDSHAADAFAVGSTDCPKGAQ